jgi:type II secretory pathway pseudopilin PulG
MVAGLRRLRGGTGLLRDEGIGLVEVVIAMMLLALLAVSFLPVLIQGLQTAAVNATRSTGNQLVQQQIENARVQGYCQQIVDLGAAAVSPVVDPRGVTLLTTRTPGTCPVSYPGTISFEVSVTREDTGEVLSTATTLIFVDAYTP